MLAHKTKIAHTKMEKLVFLAWILILTTPVYSKYYSRTVPYKAKHEKKTHLRFYVHDIIGGKHPTSVQVAGPKNTTPKPNDPTPFGTTFAIDDPLTEGPELTSKVIGNMRGLCLLANQDKLLTLVLYVDIGFASGKFNGSSLSVLSRNPVTENPREMAVVGGRGRFRFANGYVTVRTHFLDVTNGDAVLEYNVEVIHP